MCGIVGCVGGRDAPEIDYEGLRRLEYRGDDSAGLALLDVANGGGRLVLRCSVGKLANFGRILAEQPIHGEIGIGHTPWATHGRPSETNAHHHLDCRGETVVIYNGIAENYLALKRRLVASGHVLRSKTDTEVVVHDVEEGLTEGVSLQEAVRLALGELRGNHAIDDDREVVAIVPQNRVYELRGRIAASSSHTQAILAPSSAWSRQFARGSAGMGFAAPRTRSPRRRPGELPRQSARCRPMSIM